MYGIGSEAARASRAEPRAELRTAAGDVAGLGQKRIRAPLALKLEGRFLGHSWYPFVLDTANCNSKEALSVAS